jgi:predicted transcriptional regulator
MNQRLLHKDCFAKDYIFYGVNLSKNLTKYLMKYLPNSELRKVFLMIDL